MVCLRLLARVALSVLALQCLPLPQIEAVADPVSKNQTGLAALSLPEGFSVELAAAAPLVERPMLASFDDRGRLYVCDSAGVNFHGPALAANPPHVIRRLEDTDGDGRFDKSTVFADKLVFPQGIVWHAGAVYCSSPPSFWKLTDSDDDGRADQREELASGFANTGVADDMHGGSLGPDGRIYWCAGRFPHEIQRPGGPVIHRGTAPLILRAKPDGSELEVVCGSQGNAVGVAFSDEGDMFSSGTFLAPNSMGAGLRDALVHCVDGAEYPVRDRKLNEHKRTGEMLPPLTHLGVSASSDLMFSRAGAWGEEYRGNLFSALFNMHKIVRHRLDRSGATFTCRNEDFLISSDNDFHPTDVFEDADGSLLVIDTGGWFHIGCPTSQISKPDVLGGIYRVRKTGAQTAADPRGLKIAWQSLSADDLVKLLSDPRFEVRDRAVRQLGDGGDAAVGPLAAMLKQKASTQSHCAAIWALERIEGDAARGAVRAALDHPSPSVRQAAARSTGLHRDARAIPRLAQLVTSDEPPVRREAATALGRIGKPAAVPALLGGLNHSGDRFLEHALIFALIRINDREVTLAGLDSASPGTQRGALIALDQMDGGRLTPEQVTPLLAQADPQLEQAALWVVSHHGQWGGAMKQFFRDWLARPSLDEAGRDVLLHQPRGAKPQDLQAGLAAEFYELGDRSEAFPDLAATPFDAPLAQVATNLSQAVDVRVQAAAAVMPRLAGVEPALFDFLLASLDGETPPLVRLDAAEALSKAHLDDQQLKRVSECLATAGVLEVPKLVRAFEQSHNAEIGRQLIAALERSPGLRALDAASLEAVLRSFPSDVRGEAGSLVQQLNVNVEKQQARLAELADVLAGGDVQRGRDLFFANKKAICATCHAVQGEGGRIGPDLTKIGAIRAPRDLLEAVVFPSASFARGYEPFTVATSDGQVVSGIIGRETSDAIYLVGSSRVEVRVPRASIESLAQGTVSIMPEGMDAQLSRQDLADLIAFLHSLR